MRVERRKMWLLYGSDIPELQYRFQYQVMINELTKSRITSTEKILNHVRVQNVPSAHLAALDPFYIEVDFIGTWTDARRAVFQSAADR